MKQRYIAAIVTALWSSIGWAQSSGIPTPNPASSQTNAGTPNAATGASSPSITGTSTGTNAPSGTTTPVTTATPAASASQPGIAPPGTVTGNTITGSNQAGTPGTGTAPAATAGMPEPSGAGTTSGSSGTSQGATSRPAGTAAQGTRNQQVPGSAQVGAGSTPGWSMMTAQEQQVYSDRMQSATTAEQCRTYHAAYMAQMQARARNMGQLVEPQRTDPCAGLQR